MTEAEMERESETTAFARGAVVLLHRRGEDVWVLLGFGSPDEQGSLRTATSLLDVEIEDHFARKALRLETLSIPELLVPWTDNVQIQWEFNERTSESSQTLRFDWGSSYLFMRFGDHPSVRGEPLSREYREDYEAHAVTVTDVE